MYKIICCCALLFVVAGCMVTPNDLRRIESKIDYYHAETMDNFRILASDELTSGEKQSVYRGKLSLLKLDVTLQNLNSNWQDSMLKQRLDRISEGL